MKKITPVEYKVSLFVPVFNEEKIIERHVKTFDHAIRKVPFDYEIFIVNDASDDKTAIIAEKIRQIDKNISLLNYKIGPTRRENLAQAFKKAGGDIIVFADMDLIMGSYFLPDLTNLINEVTAGYDIAIGSRYVPGAKIKRKPFRLLISILYNVLVRFMFKTGIHDHMCGFKAFKKDVISKLVDEMGYDETLRRGVFWDTELLIRAIRHGYKIKEIPVSWQEGDESALYFKREIKAIPYIIKFKKEIDRKC